MKKDPDFEHQLGHPLPHLSTISLCSHSHHFLFYYKYNYTCYNCLMTVQNESFNKFGMKSKILM